MDASLDSSDVTRPRILYTTRGSAQDINIIVMLVVRQLLMHNTGTAATANSWTVWPQITVLRRDSLTCKMNSSQTFRLFKNTCDTADEQLLDKILYITFSTTYFLHPLLPHSPTTSGEDSIVSCFRNTLVTLRFL